MLIVAGVLGTIAGILALVFPDVTLLALALIAGINLLLLGALSLVDSFSDDGDTTARVLAAVLGLLGIMAGLVVMRRPGESLLAVLLVLGIWLVVTGIVDLVRAFANAAGPRVPAARPRSSTSCSAALILALPDVSLKTLALLIGIAFIVRGVLSVVAGRRAATRGPGMIDDHLDEYRALRTRLEERILAIATSIDGRRFSLQAPLQGLELPPGGYAILEHDGTKRLGQVLVAAARAASTPPRWGGRRRAAGPAVRSRLAIRAATRRGRDPVRRRRAVPRRHDPRRDARRGRRLARARAPAGRAQLPVGELRLAPGVPFALDAGGFDRHTFFCGQSGSGKTYSLGVVLEQLLLETSLRIVILDPNSDMTRLREVRAGVDEATAARWRALAGGIDIRSGTGDVAPVPAVPRAQPRGPGGDAAARPGGSTARSTPSSTPCSTTSGRSRSRSC